MPPAPLKWQVTPLRPMLNRVHFCGSCQIRPLMAWPCTSCCCIQLHTSITTCMYLCMLLWYPKFLIQSEDESFDTMIEPQDLVRYILDSWTRAWWTWATGKVLPLDCHYFYTTMVLIPVTAPRLYLHVWRTEWESRVEPVITGPVEGQLLIIRNDWPA